MCFVSRSALTTLTLLALALCLSIGCSEEKSVQPKPEPTPGITHLWSKRFGDGAAQYAEAVAVDASGNVIVTGEFDGTVHFGTGALASVGSLDAYLAKFAPDGSHLWSQRFGDGNWQLAEDVAVDAAGNIIITGRFAGTVDFGGGALTSSGGYDIFVAKFSSDGAHFWSKNFGDGANQDAREVAIDASGNVLVTGYFEGTVDFGGGALTSSGLWDAFVAKFAADGTYLWSKRFGDADYQDCWAIAADASGNLLVTGYFGGAVDFGGGSLTSAGSYDIFVAKFNPDGSYLWSKRFGDAGEQRDARAVAVDASGNVIVMGYFVGTVFFGGGALTSAGGYDMFVAKFSPDGTHLWSKSFGNADDQYGRDVVVSASNSVIVTGYFAGAIDFGGGALTSTGTADILVAKLGSDGAYIWSRRFGDTNRQFGLGVAVDGTGNVFATGYFWSAVDFGGGALTSAGAEDIYVVKFSQ